MTAALIILAAIVVVGALCLLYELYARRHGADAPEEPAEQAEAPEECCGQHAVCERDSLLAALEQEAVYFDDEELDRYAGRSADTYTAEEADEFRDVLLTLLPDDVAPWARSIQMRGIELPPAVRDELLMIVGENRINREHE